MKTERFKVYVSESIGEVTMEITSPDSVKACIVLAHGAGADMDHRFMVKLAEHLADAGFAVMRYNFPFTENKKARPDPAPVAEKTVQVVIQKAMELFPSIHIFAGGKSFGGRMTSQLVSKKPIDNLKGLIFYGFPLHPAGKPSIDRATHLAGVTVPMLFLQGTKDSLAQMPLITQVVSTLPTSTLTVFDGADHGFSIGKKDVITDLTEATVSWYRKLF
jgi:uncharacterized protein